MKNANQTAIDEGRAQQFDEMMAQLAAMQAKYKGVRGELLAKVREEFEKLKPGAATESAPAPAKSVAAPSKPAPAPEPAAAPAKTVTTPSKPVPAATRAAVQAMLPSCRLCGRSMKRADDGSLVCAVGHIRAAA
ncbi:MAG: hypothetical protein GQE15_16325 [Archangiaceae bacterium]|nr:hypothetical protein [Archangiaceae bacterium]